MKNIGVDMLEVAIKNIFKHKDFLQTRKEPYAIYLAINTNIKSYNNICPSEQYCKGYFKKNM
ncbi:hypothetical protein BZM00_09380 [Campylobacter jejuni]|nr:hypothetical protein [Campylobacter jejuni]